MEATLYRTDGTTEQVKSDGREFSLEELQGFVGGYIELVPRSRPYAYCNEEGLIDGLPSNEQASVRFGIHLVGNVVQMKAKGA